MKPNYFNIKYLELHFDILSLEVYNIKEVLIYTCDSNIPIYKPENNN
jgi:hypothetical protein